MLNRLTLVAGLALVLSACSKTENAKNSPASQLGAQNTPTTEVDQKTGEVAPPVGEEAIKATPLPTQRDRVSDVPPIDEADQQSSDLSYDENDFEMDEPTVEEYPSQGLSNMENDFVGSLSPEEQAESMQIEQEMNSQIQSALRERGFDPGVSDGIIGPETANSIRQFQRENGLNESGELDEQTLNLLMGGIEEDFEYSE